MGEDNGSSRRQQREELLEEYRKKASQGYDELIHGKPWKWWQIAGMVVIAPVGAIFALLVCIILALLFIGFCAVIGALCIAFVVVVGVIAIPLAVISGITAIFTAPFRSWSIGQAWREYCKKEKAETSREEPALLENKSCGNCKHWTSLEDFRRHDNSECRGACQRIQWRGMGGENKDDVAALQTEIPGSTQLRTCAEFGCLMWEPV